MIEFDSEMPFHEQTLTKTYCLRLLVLCCTCIGMGNQSLMVRIWPCQSSSPESLHAQDAGAVFPVQFFFFPLI